MRILGWLLVVSLSFPLSSAKADTPDLLIVPRESMEYMVKWNLMLQKQLEKQADLIKKQEQHINTLQAAKNCV